jgi:DNA-binding transcriptional LysR family regulator
MELRNLKTFYYASTFLNFSRTAEYLNFSQPKITSQIHILENELGFQLFFRVGKNTFLTPAGEKVKEYAEKILTLVDELENEMILLHNPHGQLNIAAYETYCTSGLQPIIARFYERHPQVDIRITACNSEIVEKDIEENEFDIGIISGYSENIIIGEDPIVLVVSKRYVEDYSKERLLSDLPLIRYITESPYGDLLNQYIIINRFDNHRSYHFYRQFYHNLIH